jgi:hypothetical protein
LIVSLSAQGIKGYLTRPADFQSLAQQPEVAEALRIGGGPVKLAYCNSPRLFDTIYPMLPMYLKFATWGLDRTGVKLSPMMLPSARAIRSHLKPAVIAVRRTKAGIEVIEQRTLPGPSLTAIGPIGAAVLLPAIGESRGAARRTMSMNNTNPILK